MESSVPYCAEYLTEEDDEEMQQENGGDGDDDDHNNDDDTDDNDDDDNDDDHNNNDDDTDDNDDDDDDNDIRILIGREITAVRLNDEEVEVLVNDNWNQEIRTHAIRYIRRTGRQFRMSRRTIYRAVMYLDRFLAHRILDNGRFWAVRLLAVACLSLSARMDQREYDVPLSDYPVGAYNINVNDIRRMEILVLIEFNWDMNCVAPFDFRNFFISRFCRDVTRIDITRMTTGVIIMSVLRDLRIMNHRPSVIAAAATLVAVNKDFTIQELEIEINALPINGFLQIAGVSYCYNRMLELNIGG